VVLATDIDDMAAEYVADAADALRRAGALDVVLIGTTMKKGRPGVRVEVLARLADADRLEDVLFASTSTIGVRRLSVERRALARRETTVSVLGESVAVKVTTLPNGSVRAKPAYEDVRRAAEATGRPIEDIFALAAEAAASQQPVESPSRDAAGVPPGAESPDHTRHLVRTRSQV
jgi:uncharacterized protein (DUF111 family)